MNNLEGASINPMRLRDTFFIQPTDEERPGGSLAINPEINYSTHLIAWQDTTLHAKNLRFKSVNLEQNGSLNILREDGNMLKLVPLTIELFRKHIQGNVPVAALKSDEALRQWYSDFADNPEDESLWRT